jgi:hypothetical protein
VNRSTTWKTICQIQFQPLENYQISEVPGVQDFEKSLVTFQPLGAGGGAVQIRLDDTLSIPLDVEPLRSKSPYLAVAVSPVPLRQLAASNKETWKPYAHLVALDITGKCLASADLIIPYP